MIDKFIEWLKAYVPTAISLPIVLLIQIGYLIVKGVAFFVLPIDVWHKHFVE